MGERARLLLEHRLEGHEEELQRLVDEQTALRRVATLVAAGASDVDLVAEVTSEIAQLFGADRAAALRWDGDTIRIIGDWSVEVAPTTLEDRVYSFGGDTITARVVKSGAPARVESVDDLQTEFARARWDELGIQASIGGADRRRRPGVGRDHGVSDDEGRSVRTGRGAPARRFRRARRPGDRELGGPSRGGGARGRAGRAPARRDTRRRRAAATRGARGRHARGR